MWLIGDVGGTKVHLALVKDDQIIKEEKFWTSHFHSLSEILDKFLDAPVQKGCLAVAGPVTNRQCQMTNTDWRIDANHLEKQHQIPQVALLNDLLAAGWGLNRLKPQDLVTLNRGKRGPGNQAIVSAGTGLGIVGLYWDGKHHYPFASEGGHADFAPRNETEKKFWNHLHQQFGHVSIERAVSGKGFEHLCNFLRKDAQDPIVLTQFASLYGAVAGNVALQFLTTGGLYLAGGMPPKLLKTLQEGDFMNAFLDKGRFQTLLTNIPVEVVLNESLPLLGAWELMRLKF